MADERVQLFLPCRLTAVQMLASLTDIAPGFSVAAPVDRDQYTREELSFNHVCTVDAGSLSVAAISIIIHSIRRLSTWQAIPTGTHTKKTVVTSDDLCPELNDLVERMDGVGAKTDTRGELIPFIYTLMFSRLEQRACGPSNELYTAVSMRDLYGAQVVMLYEVSWRSPTTGVARTCDYCKAPETSKKCGRCRLVHYCDRKCQRAAWPMHRIVCT